MNTEKATVTIPYSEFEKHNKELESAKSELESIKKQIMDANSRLIAISSYASSVMKTINTANLPENPEYFFDKIGYKYSGLVKVPGTIGLEAMIIEKA